MEILQKKQKNQNLNFEKALDLSKNKTRTRFVSEVTEAAKHLDAPKNIIILDKVTNSPKDLEQFKKKFPRFGTKFIAIVPKDSETFEIDEQTMVPFSATMILNLCYRALVRKNHTFQNTNDSSQSKKLLIILSFFKLYENISNVEKAKSREFDFDEFVKVPFHKPVEDELTKIDSELLEEMSQALEKIKIFRGDGRECDKLVSLLSDKKIVKELEDQGLLSFPDTEEQRKAVLEILDCFE